jgi:hypothetical protein
MKTRYWFVALWVVCLMGARVALALQPQDDQFLGQLETRFFNQNFPNEPPEARLARLENSVYGEVSAQRPTLERVNRLKTVFTPTPRPTFPPQRSAPPMGQQPGVQPPVANPGGPMPPFHTSTNRPPNGVPNGPASAMPPQRAANESDYPVVDEIEQRVLGQQFRKEALEMRIPRLEQRVFGQPGQGDLSDRVDRLKATVIPGAAQAADDADAPNGGQDAMSSTQGGDGSGIPAIDMNTSLNQTEQRLFRQTYPNEPVESRLARLETRLFNQTAPPDVSPQDRIERIVSVASGGGDRPATPLSPNAALAKQLIPIAIMLLPLLI